MFENLKSMLGKSSKVEMATRQYEQAQTRYTELQKRATTNDRLIADQLGALSGANRQGDSRRMGLDAAALALIADTSAEVGAVPAGTRSDRVVERLDGLYRERVVINRALQLARDQKIAAGEKLARTVADECEPAYKAIVKRIGNALGELQEALKAEAEFRTEFTSGGLDCPLEPATLPGGRERLDHTATTWARDMKRAGLLS